jgi:hypothetical protein
MDVDGDSVSYKISVHQDGREIDSLTTSETTITLSSVGEAVGNYSWTVVGVDTNGASSSTSFVSTFGIVLPPGQAVTSKGCSGTNTSDGYLFLLLLSLSQLGAVRRRLSA